MPIIVVANPKGGVGKSTLSTQLAGYFAHQGHSVALGDLDRQQSARTWLSIRPTSLPTIDYWDIHADQPLKLPKSYTHAVLDTPAGLEGKALEKVVKLADKILIPLQPSIFDIYATRAFFDELQALKKHDKVSIATLANRAKAGSIAVDQLHTFIKTLQLPFLGEIRDTQNYIHLAAHGLTLWDIHTTRSDKDLQQWQPIIKWVTTA